jgi:hypothetical protein
MAKLREDNVDRAYRIHGTDENAYGILVGKHEGKIPLLRFGRRLEDGIKIYLKEKGCEVVDQHQALVNMIMNHIFQLKSGRFFDQLCYY